MASSSTSILRLHITTTKSMFCHITIHITNRVFKEVSLEDSQGTWWLWLNGIQWCSSSHIFSSFYYSHYILQINFWHQTRFYHKSTWNPSATQLDKWIPDHLRIQGFFYSLLEPYIRSSIFATCVRKYLWFFWCLKHFGECQINNMPAAGFHC